VKKPIAPRIVTGVILLLILIFSSLIAYRIGKNHSVPAASPGGPGTGPGGRELPADPILPPADRPAGIPALTPGILLRRGFPRGNETHR
jgi:hypothetical protein